MGLKRRFSFWWRLFVPICVSAWLIVGFLMAYQYKREKDYREAMMQRQLGLFSSRIIQAYDNNMDIRQFMNMLTVFFQDSQFENVRVSVYTRDDVASGHGPSYYMGRPIDKDFVAKEAGFDDSNVAFHTVGHSRTGDLYYYRSTKSNDGNLLIYTAMPYTVTIRESLSAADTAFWLILVGLLAIVTFAAYWITTDITRSIRLLRDFASQANNANVKFDETKFPHNELGEISRDIVRLYRERTQAMEKSQREHNIAMHAIEEKSRIKRQMTNNINHELKTPVGVIKGYLDTVLTAEGMDDEMRTYFLKRAQDNVDRLCNLLNDVSTMTRLEEGSGNIPVTQLNFHDLVYAVDNDFTTAGMTGNMTFDFDIPLDCEVMGNNNLLTSAISNLVKNAVIHSHGTEMGIRLVAESGKYYTFAFWDNGTGVDPTHLPHLFDRFYRVDSGRSRKTGGTGLGLPIVKNIIESLGGSMSVSNRAGGGLQFMFTLKKAA
ncbi:MAG: HAMP domain-containing histidine kinase [Bacteroides sp.]|nr:HAMP domain-containing histidine kinase [Bacteroides sp.]